MCFLLMRTTKWPNIRTSKDRRHDLNVKPYGTESNKIVILKQQNVGSSNSYLSSLHLVQRENQ